MARLSHAGGFHEIYGEATDYEKYLNAMTRTSTWVSFAEKTQVQIAAARLLDRQLWKGDPTQPVVFSFAASLPAMTQGIQWPRSGVLDRNKVEVLDTVIPDDILMASYEIAYALTQPTPDIENETAEQKIKRQRDKVGPVEQEIEYFSDVSLDDDRFPQIIQELLQHYLRGSSNVAVGASYGTGLCSEFAKGQYDYTGRGGLL